MAALYRADIDFQSNASWCGPASIGNVLLSLHRPGDQSTILEGTGIATVLGFLAGRAFATTCATRTTCRGVT